MQVRFPFLKSIFMFSSVALGKLCVDVLTHSLSRYFIRYINPLLLFKIQSKSSSEFQVYAWGDASYGALGRDDRLEEERQIALSMGSKKGMHSRFSFSRFFFLPFSFGVNNFRRSLFGLSLGEQYRLSSDFILSYIFIDGKTNAKGDKAEVFFFAYFSSSSHLLYNSLQHSISEGRAS